MSLTETSVVARQLRRLRTAVRAAVDESRVVAAGGRLRASVGESVEASVESSGAVAGLDRIADTIGRWVRGGWLYGWLTAEPEPEVVVIDLRKTYTVGPVVTALDRAVEWATPRWRESTPQRVLDRGARAVADAPVRVAGFLVIGAAVATAAVTLARGGFPGGGTLVLLGLALLATRERRSAAELRETWLGRAVATLLIPPEPPGERDSAEERDAPGNHDAAGARDATEDRDGPGTREEREPERDA